MRLIAALVFSFLLSGSIAHAEQVAPYKGEAKFIFRNLERYEEWPATERSETIARDVDWSSHKDSWNYRTRLRAGLQAGANYAGKYAVISHGCGTSCQVNWVVNVETGKIIGNFTSSYGVQYREDSRLLIADLPLDKDNNIFLDEVSNYIKPRFYIVGEDYLDLYWVIDFCDFKTGCERER